MSYRNIIPFTLISHVLLAGGCVTEETDPAALEFRTTPAQCSPPCDVTGNSPEVNDFDLGDLNLNTGMPNSDGVVVQGIRLPGDPTLYRLGLFGQDLAAYDGDTRVAHTMDLADAEIVLSRSGVQNIATIESVVRDSPSWAANGAEVSLYAISYIDSVLAATPENICPGFNYADPVVTLLVGETYDGDSKTVNPNQTGFITLACRGEAAYKMKFLNYAPLLDFDGLGNSATVDQRQATLKMITADYCGSGESYTAQGTLVSWANAAGTVNLVPEWHGIEAVWGPDGALCLGAQRYPLAGDPRDECPALPVCDPTDLPAGEWVTWLKAED